MPSTVNSPRLSDSPSQRSPLTPVAALLLMALWVNLSEVLRYFALVMPMTRAALPEVEGVAPMNLPVFLVWGVWDTIFILVAARVIWLHFEKFGGGMRRILEAATLVWALVFVLFWMAAWNMRLTVGSIALSALPLAWIEMVVAAAILERGWRNRPGAIAPSPIAE
jgi:hypothetical protein